MDIAGVATGLAQANVAAGAETSVLKSVENLAMDQAARLFANLGIGQNVDVYA